MKTNSSKESAYKELCIFPHYVTACLMIQWWYNNRLYIIFCSRRGIWYWHQRLGWWRCPPLQKVPSQQPLSGASSVTWLVPPVAREALCWWAPPRPVPHVHAVQGHERGLARPAGDAVLQARDRGSPPQAETTKFKFQENMKSQCWLSY